MFNWRLKSFGNGTAQLCYYHNPIFSKELKAEPPEPKHFNRRDYLAYCKEQDELIDFSDFNEICEWVKTPFEEPGLEELRLRSVMSSLNRTKKMIVDYGRSNKWEWFVTLTFKPVEQFDKANYEECKNKVMKWLKNVRERYANKLKYLVVPEMHESGCWHFHCMLSDCGELEFDVAKNQQKYLKDKFGKYQLNEYGARIPNKYFGKELRTRYPDGQLIYNIKQFKNGWTTATKINDTRKAVSYILKYITKDLCDIAFGKRRYLQSKNLNLPVITTGYTGDYDINDIFSYIEYKHGLKLSIENVKSYSVKVPGYENVVTVFEFNYPEDSGDDFAGRELCINEILENVYGKCLSS